MAFLPMWPPLGVDGSSGAGTASALDTDAVRVASVPTSDPDNQGYFDQQPGDYGDPVPCTVIDLRATRLAAGLTPVGVAQFVITSYAPIGVTQANQGILWSRNVFGVLADPLALRSDGEQIAPNSGTISGNQLWVVYATARD